MAVFDGETLSTAASSSSESGATIAASDNSNNQSDETVVGVVLDATPFYAEAGGQVADRGKISIIVEGEGKDGEDDAVRGVIDVADVRMFGGFTLHVGRLVSGR